MMKKCIKKVVKPVHMYPRNQSLSVFASPLMAIPLVEGKKTNHDDGGSQSSLNWTRAVLLLNIRWIVYKLRIIRIIVAAGIFHKISWDMCGSIFVPALCFEISFILCFSQCPIVANLLPPVSFLFTRGKTQPFPSPGFAGEPSPPSKFAGNRRHLSRHWCDYCALYTYRCDASSAVMNTTKRENVVWSPIFFFLLSLGDDCVVGLRRGYSRVLDLEPHRNRAGTAQDRLRGAQDGLRDAQDGLRGAQDGLCGAQDGLRGAQDGLHGAQDGLCGLI